MYLMGYSDRALINPYVCLSVCLSSHPSVRPSGRPFSFNCPSGCARRNFDFRSTFPLDHDETLRRVADRRLTHRRRRRNEKCGQMDQNEYLTRHDITRLSTKLSQQTGREIFLQFGTQHSTRSREVDDTSTRYPRYRWPTGTKPISLTSTIFSGTLNLWVKAPYPSIFDALPSDETCGHVDIIPCVLTHFPLGTRWSRLRVFMHICVTVHFYLHCHSTM